MKWDLRVTIEADTLVDAWFIAATQLPTSFSPAGWKSEEVRNFYLGEQLGTEYVEGAK